MKHTIAILIMILSISSVHAAVDKSIYVGTQEALHREGIAYQAATRLKGTDCGFALRLPTMWVSAPDEAAKIKVNKMNVKLRMDITQTILAELPYSIYLIYAEHIEPDIDALEMITGSCTNDAKGNLISVYDAMTTGIRERLRYHQLRQVRLTPYEL